MEMARVFGNGGWHVGCPAALGLKGRQDIEGREGAHAPLRTPVKNHEWRARRGVTTPL